MAPRSYDPSVDSAVLLGIGAAFAVSEPDPAPEPAGRIWVPFEGAHGSLRGGWRERPVHQPTRPSARQPLGFRPR